MNNINNRRIHRRRHDILIRAQLNLLQRPSQLLRLTDIDRHEFQDAVLRYDAEDERAAGLGVLRHEGDTSGARLDHACAGFVEGAFGVDGDCFGGCDAEGTFDFCW